MCFFSLSLSLHSANHPPIALCMYCAIEGFSTSPFSYQDVEWMSNSLFCRQSALKNRSDCHIFIILLWLFVWQSISLLSKNQTLLCVCVSFSSSSLAVKLFIPILLLFIMRIYSLPIDDGIPVGLRPATCKSIVCPNWRSWCGARFRCGS